MALDVAAFKQTQRKIWSVRRLPRHRPPDRVGSRAPGQGGRRAGRDRTSWTWRPAAATSRSSRAQRGAKVTGLDITPELFDAARRRAAEAGVDMRVGRGGRGGAAL